MSTTAMQPSWQSKAADPTDTLKEVAVRQADRGLRGHSQLQSSPTEGRVGATRQSVGREDRKV